MKTRYLLSAAALLMAGSAQAVVTPSASALLTDGGSLAVGEVMLLDFEGASPELSLLGGGDLVTGGQYLITTGLTPGIAAPPLNNVSQYLAVLGQNQQNNGPGEVLINFGLQASSFSFDLGSIDTYNTFQVFYLGQNQTWTGLDMATGSYGNQQIPQSNRRITFTGDAGERFTAIKLVSSQNSLEVDNFAVNAVPEPATWALMMLGFGLVGAAARRRGAGPRAVAA